ncbi:lysylphosphatidylglycerol synthase transmembrane domain-containing protein [Saccharothrix mutabilis subsp. mutabilis]|uniref:Lysylphosphatidylglycerol synthase transmembrane domain-containing protein n=1 Tax=Saccharothrix mutabilis subsp. mutabilis TaxID=66855 RepID=A0ABP3DUW1_9PSEU
MTTVDTEPTVGTTPAKSLKSQLLNWARRLLVLVVVVAAGYQLATNWSEVWGTISGIAWQSAVLSQVAVVVSIVFGVLGWQTMVDDLGKPIGVLRGAQINLVGLLGKYVPGSLWAYVLQMELGRKAGLARARVFTAALVQVGVSIVVSLLLGAAALPVLMDETPEAVWLFALLPFGLVALHPRVLTWATSLVLRVLRRPPLDHRLKWSTVGKVFGYAVLGFGFQGLHLWLLANSVGAPGFGGLVLCVGAMALAMTIGLFFFIMPAGAGARELVMAAVLVASGIEPVQAGAFAVASRVMFIVADLLTAGAAAGLAHWRKPAAAPAAD